jgi:hypothetical protein
MLIDKTNGKLEEIKLFAEQIGKAEKLQRELDYLSNYAGNAQCELYPDWAYMSLRFILCYTSQGSNKVLRMNGGLTYHGDPDQSLSVCLSSPDGWEIHT